VAAAAGARVNELQPRAAYRDVAAGVAFLSRGRWVTVPPTPLGVPTYLQKCTTSVVRGHPPTYRKVRHSVNLLLNLVLRSMHTKFSTVVGGTHLPTEMYDISRPGGPIYLQKCTTVAP
jgi:hypothetical protein